MSPKFQPCTSPNVGHRVQRLALLENLAPGTLAQTRRIAGARRGSCLHLQNRSRPYAGALRSSFQPARTRSRERSSLQPLSAIFQGWGLRFVLLAESQHADPSQETSLCPECIRPVPDRFFSLGPAYV